jgi:hypothetical protein
MPENRRIAFCCTECGSEVFTLPNNPPQDSDLVRCAGCKRTIGTYRDVRRLAAQTDLANVTLYMNPGE